MKCSDLNCQKPTMKWYRVLAASFCGSVVLTLVGVLTLCSFHVYNSDLAVPLDHVSDWMVHIIALVPISVIIMVANVGCLPLIFSDNKMRFFVAMLVGNGVCIVIALYFTVAFSIQMGTQPATGDFLYKKTLALISNQSSSGNGTLKKWIPKWLDKVQRNSKTCCGVITFRDWEQLWPDTPDNIPHSCCTDPASVTRCVTDFQKIPFPGTPSMFVKTDSGCVDEINDAARKGIADSFILMLVVAILVALAEVAYAIQFYQLYVPLIKSKGEPPVLPLKTPQDDPQGLGDGTDPTQLTNGDGSGSLLAGSNLTGSSLGSVITTGAPMNYPGGSGVPASTKIGSVANKKGKIGQDGATAPGGVQYGPAGVSGTIIGGYNEPPQGVANIGSSSSFDSEEDDDAVRSKKPKKKKKKRKDQNDLPDGNYGIVQPDMTPAYTVVNADDDLVGDRLPQQQQDLGPGGGPQRGKIFGMTRSRKKNT